MMRKGSEMEVVVMLVGIVLLMSIQMTPSSAQPLPACWQRIVTCFRDDTQVDCCPVLLQEIKDERECFCSIKPDLDKNATIANDISTLINLCDSTATLNTVCPGSPPGPIESPPSMQPPGADCWDAYEDCRSNNLNRSALEPHLNPDSPAFNLTEFLCCPLLQQISTIEKQCFCLLNTAIQRNSSVAPNIILLFSTCNIVDSVAALNNFCLAPTTPTTQALPLHAGEVPSPAPAPAPAFLGEPSLLQPDNKGSKGSAANKPTMIGSLSGLFVLFTYVLIQ